MQAFGFDEAEAQEQVGARLPDLLPYGYTSAAGYPNGRKLADDAVLTSSLGIL